MIVGTMRPIRFVHIPKTGGTAVETTLAQLDASSRLSSSFPRGCGHGLVTVTPQQQCNAQHVPPGWFIGSSTSNGRVGDHCSPYHGSDTFTIVRHPFDRLLSEYLWACRDNRPTISAVSTHPPKRMHELPRSASFDQCCTLSLLWQALDQPMKVLPMKMPPHVIASMLRDCWANVSQMNAYLQAGMRTASFRAGAGSHRALTYQNWANGSWATIGYDCHFVPQSEYLNGTEHMFCTMAQLRRFLMDRYGHVENASTLVGRLREVPSHNHLDLDGTTRALAHEHYREDFRLCGFHSGITASGRASEHLKLLSLRPQPS